MREQTIGGKNGIGGDDKDFVLTKDTAVVTEALAVARKLADLKTEQQVDLRLTVDQKSVVRITILGE